MSPAFERYMRKAQMPDDTIPHAPSLTLGETIIQLIGEHVHAPATADTLMIDLGDDITRIGIVMAVEEHCSIDLLDEEAEMCRTVGDLIERVGVKLGEEVA